MSQHSKYQHVKSRYKVIKTDKPVFHLQDKKADDAAVPIGLIKSAKRTGQLCLNNRGLGSVPEKVWKIDELVLEESKQVDFDRSDSHTWWNSEPLKTLDLGSNAIASIPPDIRFLQELVTLKKCLCEAEHQSGGGAGRGLRHLHSDMLKSAILDLLHDNALTALPPEIGQLSTLANLSVHHNKLVALPKEFYKLTELRWLSLAHNQLEKIEPDFGDLVMLNFLDLSHNKLSALPPGMGYLVRLTELNLSHNQLQELPPDIVNLRELKKLNICHNNLKNLPAMGELRKMEILDANHNDLVEMPDFVGCTALKEIYMANNCIQELSEEFCEAMQQLQVLNVRDNRLQLLPDNVVLLKSLKRFDLTNNNLNKLPSNLGLLTQLQSISMEGNRLSFVRQDVIRGGTDRMLKYLRDRMTDEITSETKYESEWPDKYTLRKSQALMAAGRALPAVPDGVWQTAVDAEVHIVDLARNNLTSVPTGVCNLHETLTQLILSTNHISVVPAEVGRLSNLQFLDLSKNAIADLPIELAELKNLRELNLNSNRLPKIPRCVYELTSLEILLAADNRVSEINVSSDALARMKRLAVLDLANNSIVTVPPELGNFTHLRSLELMGNCFRQPRHAILAKGTQSVLAYLRDRIPT